MERICKSFEFHGETMGQIRNIIWTSSNGGSGAELLKVEKIPEFVEINRVKLINVITFANFHL